MIAALPPVALTASPARVELAGAASRTIRIANPGRFPTVVDVGPAGFALDLRGRPRIVGRADRTVSISVRPRRVVLPAGAAVSLVVSSSVSAHARPGDHAALVVAATRPRGRGGVAVRMRVGVLVVVRVPGVVRHRLRLLGLRLRHRAPRRLDVAVRNGGNVLEQLGPAALRVRFRRGGRVVATVRAAGRELLPGARGVVGMRCPPGLHGKIAAVAELRRGGAPTLRRTLRIRLP